LVSNYLCTHGLLVMGILVHMGTFLMNREDIIRMARDSSNNSQFTFVPEQNDDLVCLYLNELERFVTIVEQLERERIAKKLEQLPFGDTAASFAIYVRES